MHVDEDEHEPHMVPGKPDWEVARWEVFLTGFLMSTVLWAFVFWTLK